MNIIFTKSQIFVCASFFFACCNFFAGFSAAQENSSSDPAEIYGSLPAIGDIELSPDGSKAVMLIAKGNTYHVVLLDIAKSKTKLLMAANPEEFTYNWCQFANNTRIVCSMGSFIELKAGQIGIGRRYYEDGRTVATRLIAVDIDGKNVLQLVKPKTGQSGTGRLVWNPRIQDNVVSWMRDDKKNILIQLAREDRLYPSVYKLNIYNNKISRVKKFRPGVFQWLADSKGNLRNGYGATLPSGQYRAYTVSGANASEMDVSSLGGKNRAPSFAGYIGDGESVLVYADLGKDKRGLHEIDSSDGSLKKTIYESEDFDVSGRTILNDKNELVALKTYAEGAKYIWFDQAIRDEYEEIKRSLPGNPTILDPVSYSQNLNQIIFMAFGNETLPRYYFYDRSKEKRSIVALFSNYPKANPDLVADPKYVVYKSRDGLNIPAYLTLPRGAEGQKLPTIIYPHGGPYARTTDSFDPWVQYFVAKGYAVLEPNFRGSTGYGDEFMLAGYEEWGEDMQNDLDDGLAWMVSEGIADPKRVCMVGGSYGGYAALVAAYKQPEKYKCAVAFAPVTDIAELVRSQRRFVAMQDLPVQSGEERSQNSPIEQVEKFGIPVLLVHGEVDRVVYVNQSRSLAEALKEAGKDYKYFEQENGDHNLSLENNRRQFFKEMDLFLTAHIGQ